jgi:hypothetical protein
MRVGGRPPKAPSVSYEERRLAKARERLSELKHSIEDAVGSESSPSEEEESESESECRSDEGEVRCCLVRTRDLLLFRQLYRVSRW